MTVHAEVEPWADLDLKIGGRLAKGGNWDAEGVDRWSLGMGIHFSRGLSKNTRSQVSTANSEFNKRNFIVRSLFNYLWLCNHVIGQCCDFVNSFVTGNFFCLIYCGFVCIMFIVLMCDWHMSNKFLLTYLLTKGSVWGSIFSSPRKDRDGVPTENDFGALKIMIEQLSYDLASFSDSNGRLLAFFGNGSFSPKIRLWVDQCPRRYGVSQTVISNSFSHGRITDVLWEFSLPINVTFAHIRVTFNSVNRKFLLKAA